MSRTDKEVDELAQVVLQLVHDQKLTQVRTAWSVAFSGAGAGPHVGLGKEALTRFQAVVLLQAVQT